MLCILFTCSGCQKKMSKNTEFINSMPWNQVDHLMIVAHPDDETIWGGYHLQKGKYLVVCLTNKQNETRRKEFESTIKQTNNIGLILDYPDKTNGKRDNWNTCKKQIYEDICNIINKKDYKLVVTHNPDGEYGHIHHKMTSEMVTKAMKNKKNLYYFGHYYKKNKMKKNMIPYPTRGLISKDTLTKNYASQPKVMKHLHHMFPYENWIHANDWR